jgi:hypothetical protein
MLRQGFSLWHASQGGCWGKVYSSCFGMVFAMRVALHLRAQTTIALLLPDARSVGGATAASGLLSAASGNVCLPATSRRMRISTSTGNIRIPTTGTSLLLSAAPNQSPVSVFLKPTDGQAKPKDTTPRQHLHGSTIIPRLGLTLLQPSHRQQAQIRPWYMVPTDQIAKIDDELLIKKECSTQQLPWSARSP